MNMCDFINKMYVKNSDTRYEYSNGVKTTLVQSKLISIELIDDLFFQVFYWYGFSAQFAYFDKKTLQEITVVEKCKLQQFSSK